MKYLVIALVLIVATSAFGVERKAYQIREDFGTEPLYDGALHYYYYIPCPTYSWFWGFYGWTPGEILGMCFRIGDQGFGGFDMLDPFNCHVLEQIRILDFAGYGTVYPGLFTIELDVYCCAMSQNPYLHLWNSGPLETHFAWNYFLVNPPYGISICPCCEYDFMYPRVIVTMTFTGTQGQYPQVGFDNIGTALGQACIMHDLGCLPAVYPRDWTGGVDPRVHSGYVGTYPFEYWPPLGFCDGYDTTADCWMYGFVEAAWRLYIVCSGPTATEPSSWGNIKSMYK
jgi:hypothetical protein